MVGGVDDAAVGMAALARQVELGSGLRVGETGKFNALIIQPFNVLGSPFDHQPHYGFVADPGSRVQRVGDMGPDAVAFV